ncbi:filamentous hemagglutinin N-terminal domain-containing protein [Sphingomonas sp. MMSM20]|uniref:two-partner secretion domain-containing protein n=1 Tax=Sphingomonas lycopersici TaxID=2951807 RepID=UPI002237A4D1|nr:filamentous hemagglutinin N-terminal domain-containing protein [Sphingomonas lycopersici]MCW6532573.1 filamentous hemagglutinin N-terminal domain-containing protein [Sphingomonas lycopersici]
MSAVAFGCSASAALAQTLPTGGQVQAGTATIASGGAGKLQVSQASGKAIIDWQSFSIGAGGEVRIDNGAGATLNRVTGQSLSAIDGVLSATGSVYLLNPNGVVIGKSGVVNTGGNFLASTGRISNEEFLAGGTLNIGNMSSAKVVNLGRVGSLGGSVALVGVTVDNKGEISAPKGTATGNAAGSRYGGLIGVVDTVNINTSFATGNVSGNKQVGGLVGMTMNNVTLADVYAQGSVRATTTTDADGYVGGLVGLADPTGGTQYVTNAYASGAVSAAGLNPQIGGLLGGWGGTSGGTVVVTNGYWDSAATGQAAAAPATGAGGTLRYATGTATPTTSNNTTSTSSAGARTTAQLKSGALPANFNTDVTANGNPWRAGQGLYPYFGLPGYTPAGSQSINGTAYMLAGAPAGSGGISLYLNGAVLASGITANATTGAYSAFVGAGTVSATSKLGGTLTLSGASAVAGASYTDAPIFSSGNVTGFDIKEGVLLGTSSATTNSTLQADLGATFGASTYSGLTSTLSAERRANPFRRYGAHQAAPGSRYSVGLGLAYVGAAVARHGGEITCAPNTPHGTRFTLRFPALA